MTVRISSRRPSSFRTRGICRRHLPGQAANAAANDNRLFEGKPDIRSWMWTANIQDRPRSLPWPILITLTMLITSRVTVTLSNPQKTIDQPLPNIGVNLCWQVPHIRRVSS